MKTSVIALALTTLALFTFPAAASAQEGILGVWDITWDTQRGAQTQTVTFSHDDEGAVTGSMEMTVGGTREGAPRRAAAPRTATISDIAVDGNFFSFTAEVHFGQRGRTVTMAYSGMIEGEEMTGTVEANGGRTFAFTGQRKTD